MTLRLGSAVVRNLKDRSWSWFSVTRRPGQQHPAGAACKCLAQGDEFGPPAVVRAEIACQHLLQAFPWLALVAEASKERFMENHRVGCDELLAS